MIELVGWATHQHYRDKKVPWVKQHTKSLNDPTYRCLSHGARSLLNDLWMLAGSTSDGWIRAFGGKPCSSFSLAWILREDVGYIAAALREIAAVRDENDQPRWLILHGDYDLVDSLESVYTDSRKSLSREREGEGYTKRETPALRAGDENGKATWLTPFGDAWMARFDGVPAWKRIGVAVKSLRKQGKTDPEILAAWIEYLAGKDEQFANPQDFAQHFGLWAGTAKSNGDEPAFPGYPLEDR